MEICLGKKCGLISSSLCTTYAAVQPETYTLCASRFLREKRLDEPSPQRVGGFGLGRKPPKLRSWSCTQPRAAKATAAAAVLAAWGRDRVLLP